MPGSDQPVDSRRGPKLDGQGCADQDLDGQRSRRSGRGVDQVFVVQERFRRPTFHPGFAQISFCFCRLAVRIQIFRLFLDEFLVCLQKWSSVFIFVWQKLFWMSGIKLLLYLLTHHSLLFISLPQYIGKNGQIFLSYSFGEVIFLVLPSCYLRLQKALTWWSIN